MLKAAYFDTDNTTEASRKSLKKCLHNLFEEGADYYNQLLTDLSECYRVDLERYYDALEPREIGDKGARMARVSAQKILLCLGDLARYKDKEPGHHGHHVRQSRHSHHAHYCQVQGAGQLDLQLWARQAVLRQGQPLGDEERQAIQHARHPCQDKQPKVRGSLLPCQVSLVLVVQTLTPSQVPLYQERVHVEQGGLGDHL